jgi:hypothetical protein
LLVIREDAYIGIEVADMEKLEHSNTGSTI